MFFFFFSIASGGMDGPLFKAVEASNGGRFELLRGQGNDADTVGTKKVWVPWPQRLVETNCR